MMQKIPLRVFYRTIDDLIINHQSDAAVSRALYLLQEFPRNLSVYQLLGKALLDKQEFDTAGIVFEKILEIDPDDFVSHIGISIISENFGDQEKALESMICAYELQPSNESLQNEVKRLQESSAGAAPEQLRLTRGTLIKMYSHSQLAEQTIAEARLGIHESPDRIDYKIHLAKMLNYSKHNIEAVETCIEILRTLPYCYTALLILYNCIPSTTISENSSVSKSRLIEMDPYFAFMKPEINSVDDIPDIAVMVEEHNEPEKPIEHIGEFIKLSWESSSLDHVKTGTSPQLGDWTSIINEAVSNKNIGSPITDTTYEEVILPEEEIDVPKEEVGVLEDEDIGIMEGKVVVPYEEIISPSEEIVVPEENVDIPEGKEAILPDEEDVGVNDEEVVVPYEEIVVPEENVDIPEGKEVILPDEEVEISEEDVGFTEEEVPPADEFIFPYEDVGVTDEEVFAPTKEFDIPNKIVDEFSTLETQKEHKEMSSKGKLLNNLKSSGSDSSENKNVPDWILEDSKSEEPLEIVAKIIEKFLSEDSLSTNFSTDGMTDHDSPVNLELENFTLQKKDIHNWEAEHSEHDLEDQHESSVILDDTQKIKILSDDPDKLIVQAFNSLDEEDHHFTKRCFSKLIQNNHQLPKIAERLENICQDNPDKLDLYLILVDTYKKLGLDEKSLAALFKAQNNLSFK